MMVSLCIMLTIYTDFSALSIPMPSRMCSFTRAALNLAFGGRLSSVTEITAKDGNKKQFNIGGDISLLSFNLYAETPIGKKVTVFVAGRKSYKGPIYDEIFKEFNTRNTFTQSSGGGHFGGNNQATTITSYFYDLNAKVTYTPTSKDIISLSFYNGTDKLDNSRNMTTPSFLASQGISLNSTTEDLTKYGNIGGSLKWSRKWNDRFYGNTLISYSNYYSNRNRSSSLSETNSSGETINTESGLVENNNLKDYSFKSDYQWDIYKGSRIEFGYFATYNDILYKYSINDTTTVLNRHNTGTTTGAYVQDRLQFFDNKLTILPGIRYTYFSPTSGTYKEPRLSVVYDITDKFKIKAATGQFYQFCDMVEREDILAGNRDMWILANSSSVPVSSVCTLYFRQQLRNPQLLIRRGSLLQSAEKPYRIHIEHCAQARKHH